MKSRNSLFSNLLFFRGKQLAIAWLGFILVCCIYLAKLWFFSAGSPIETNIIKLLPVDQQNPLAEQAFEKVTSNMSNKVIFVITENVVTENVITEKVIAEKAISGKDENALYSATKALEKGLSATPYFSKVVGEIDSSQQQQWSSYYFQNRFQQLTAAQRIQLTTSPNARIEQVIQSLYSPFSGVTAQELKADPFLLFRDYLAEVSARSSAFTLENGFLAAHYQGQKYLLISAELKESPYSLSAQQAVPVIKQLQSSLSQQYNVEILHTGVLFYADFGTQSAKSEISTIGLFSILGIVILVATVFGSVTPLVLSLLSISVGLLVALSITSMIFGKVHLFSLVFGASLIGVSIDYAFHYLTDRLASGNKWQSIEGLKHILAAITLGLITSLIGYLGLLVAPFPGLQQLALFSAIGLISAYVTVVVWYPILAKRPSPTKDLPGLAFWSSLLAAWQKPAFKLGLPVTVLAISLLALTKVDYNDDIKQLQAMPETLKQQEEQITQLSGLQSSQKMLLLTAKNNDALMQSLEQLQPQLQQWTDKGVIKGYQGLDQYLSSTHQQQQDFEIISNYYQQYGPVLAKQLKLTEVPVLTAQFTPVTLDDYLKQASSEPVRFLYLGEIGDDVATVILLKQPSDLETIRRFVHSEPNLLYLDKAEQLSSLFGDYRIKVMQLLAAAVIAITLVLSIRYNFTQAIKIILPSVIACIAGLAVTTITGSVLNLFNLLALVLVIGIGIDYTLFFAENSRNKSTLLAITLSATTTLLSFGLLALSQTHAIHSFGITVLSGIFVAWLLSPMAIRSSDN